MDFNTTQFASADAVFSHVAPSRALRYIEMQGSSRRVPLAQVVATQGAIVPNKIAPALKHGGPPEMLKSGNRYFIVDGHHRTAGHLLEGRKTIQAKVKEL